MVTTVARRLPAELGFLVVVSVLTLAFFRLAVADYVTTGVVLDPAIVTGLVLVWVVGYLVYGVWSHWQEAKTCRTLGLPNHLTTLRGILFAVVAGFVVLPLSGRLAWIPGVCYGAGAVVDKLDGTVARWRNSETEFGSKLDEEVDTIGFVVAPAVAVVGGQLPVWYLSLSVLTYVYDGAKYLRHARGLPVHDRPDSNAGRTIAGWQMVFLTAALAPVTDPGLVATFAPVALAPSLLVFARDYLYVSGRLPSDRDLLP